MSFFRRKKPVPTPDLQNVEQAPLSVFQDEQPPAVPRVEGEVIDVEYTDVRGPRDDDAPFGPDLPDHLVAKPELARRKRNVRLGSFGAAKPSDAIAPAAVSGPPPAAAAPDSFTAAAPGAPEVVAAEASVAVDRDTGAQESDSTSSRVPLRQRLKALVTRRPKVQRPSQNFPIRVLIGYLPEVTERDALSYSLGIAEKHVENIENAHYDVFPHLGGYVYEVHEGGSGAAFVPAVLEYFESLGPFRSEVEARMHIRTATRTVEIIRKPSQVEAVLLPESSGMQTTPEPTAGPVMRLAMNKRAGLLITGATVFITGFFAAIIIGAFMRLVPADDIRQPQPEQLNMSELPAGQWASRLQNVPEGKYVKALRYDKKAKWRTENADVVEEPAAPEAAAPATDKQGGN